MSNSLRWRGHSRAVQEKISCLERNPFEGISIFFSKRHSNIGSDGKGHYYVWGITFSREYNTYIPFLSREYTEWVLLSTFNCKTSLTASKDIPFSQRKTKKRTKFISFPLELYWEWYCRTPTPEWTGWFKATVDKENQSNTLIWVWLEQNRYEDCESQSKRTILSPEVHSSRVQPIQFQNDIASRKTRIYQKRLRRWRHEWLSERRRRLIVVQSCCSKSELKTIHEELALHM